MSLDFLFYLCSVLIVVFSDEMLLSVSGNIQGACKVVLLKSAVGLMVVQGLIEEILFSVGMLNSLNTNSNFTAQENASRGYCEDNFLLFMSPIYHADLFDMWYCVVLSSGVLLLIEFGVFSLILLYAFSLTMKTKIRHL